MILINIETLSDSELKYIAKQENLDDWDSLERDELIERLQDVFEDDLDGERGLSSEKFFKTLTTTPSDNVIQFPGTSDLPEHYNETSVYAVLRDVNWAYVFWNLSKEKREELENSSDERLVLRAKAKGKNFSEKSFDVEIEPADDNWNIELPFKDVSYVVELVCVSSKGEEVLCVSNRIETQSSYFSHHHEQLTDKKQCVLSVEPLVSKDGSMVFNRSFEEIFDIKEGN